MADYLLDSELASHPGGLRPNAERARWAIIVFWCMAGLLLIQIASKYLQINLLEAMQNGSVAYDDPSIQQNDMREAVIAFVYLALLTTAVVVFIRWSRRAYYNLHTADTPLSYTEGWAAGAWFVPFINLVRPYTIMKEIWNETQLKYTDEPESPAIVGWWWGLWLLSNFVSNIATRWGLSHTDTVDDLIYGSKIDMFSSIVELPALLVAISMMRQTAEFEAEFFRTYDPTQDTAAETPADDEDAPEMPEQEAPEENA